MNELSVNRRGRGVPSFSLYSFVIVLLFICVNVIWISQYRRMQPWDIDESGYLGIALTDYHALLTGGPTAWIRMIEAPSVQAPLTTALASMVYAIVGPHIVAGLLVPILAGAVTIVASAMIAASIAGRGAGLAAAALVATCPLMIVYARSFHFAMPATAVTAVALLALIRSREFKDLSWVSVFGISLGLLPLARTMTIAFIPGLLAGMVCVAFAQGRAEIMRRLAMLCWAVTLAIVVAASWLAFNGQQVFGYLLSFGYGSRAGEFGPAGSTLGLTAWRYTLRTLANSIYLPHACVVAFAVIASLPLFIFAGRRFGMVRAFRAVLTCKALPLLIFVIEALTALTSSQNKGSAFNAPIVPPLLIIAVWALHHLTHRFGGKRLLSFVYCGVCTTAVVPLLSLNETLARPRDVVIPGLDNVYVTNGLGTIQMYEANGGFDQSPVRPVSAEQGRAWMELDIATASRLSDLNTALIGFGFRHYLFNVNSVRLQYLVSDRPPPSLAQVEPFVTGDTQQGYESWLRTGEAARACALLTLQGEANEFEPLVTTETMAKAAEAANFRPVSHWTTPDQRTVTLWSRSGSPGCPAS